MTEENKTIEVPANGVWPVFEGKPVNELDGPAYLRYLASIKSLKRTKLFAFINGQPEDGAGHCGTILSDRGEFLLEHVVDEPEDAPAALGIGSDCHHDIYSEYAPEGWELVWVEQPLDHADVQAAYALHKALGKSDVVIKEAPVTVH